MPFDKRRDGENVGHAGVAAVVTLGSRHWVCGEAYGAALDKGR